MSSKLKDEALDQILDDAKSIHRYPYSFSVVLQRSWDIMEIIAKIKSEPLRNYDVYSSAEERAKRFKKFCGKQQCDCIGCPLNVDSIRDEIVCSFRWSQMPYESEVE